MRCRSSGSESHSLSCAAKSPLTRSAPLSPGERVFSGARCTVGQPPSKQRLCERNASVACRPSPWGEGNVAPHRLRLPLPRERVSCVAGNEERVGEGWTVERRLCSLRLIESSTTRCHSSGSKSRSDHSPLTSHHSPAARVLRRCALTLVVLLNFIALPSHADAPRAEPIVSSVDSIGITVNDLDRAVAFYTDVLGFKEIARAEVADENHARLYGVFGMRLATATLALGEERIELLEFLAPRGRPTPPDSKSDDAWFQHVAIIVSDMDRAYSSCALTTSSTPRPGRSCCRSGIRTRAASPPSTFAIPTAITSRSCTSPRQGRCEVASQDRSAVPRHRSHCDRRRRHRREPRFLSRCVRTESRGRERELWHRAGAPQQCVRRASAHHRAARRERPRCRAARVPRAAHWPPDAGRHARKRRLALAGERHRARARSGYCRARSTLRVRFAGPGEIRRPYDRSHGAGSRRTRTNAARGARAADDWQTGQLANWRDRQKTGVAWVRARSGCGRTDW